VGELNGVNVYLRRELADVHTPEKWLERAKVVREGEEPAKRVKAKKKAESELFAPWQVVDYDPGEAVDGVVPKNEHGNVYLYDQQKMMPRGCVLAKAWKKTAEALGVDCAKGVSGWEYKRGKSYPVLAEGIVVAAEFREAVEMAQEERVRHKAEAEMEKERETVIKNWRRLVRRALTFKRLGKVYKEQN
jgi:xeroderma pigmentosum group C-complementing protein